MEIKEGQWVAIKNGNIKVPFINENEKRNVIGKILNLKEGKAECRVFAEYRDCKCIQSYHGKKEIFSTPFVVKCSLSDILNECPVLQLEEYLKLKEKTDKFIFRQHYDPAEGSLTPDLPKQCTCQEILNPDEEYSICLSCRAFIHSRCLLANGKCANCEQANPLKRARPEKTFEFAFKNISETRRSALLELVKKMEKQSEVNFGQNCSASEKYRMKSREKFTSLLLYGLEEMKESGSIDKYSHLSLHKEMSEKEAINYCKKLATEIEASMWVLHHETLSNDYKYKFRSLFYNLHNDNNTELRLSILTGGISACELPQFDSTQLAPKELTKLRDEREQKYIKEKLLLATNQNVGLLVIKSHKGEEIINIADSVESRADPTKIADLIRNEIGESVTNTGKKISANPSSSSPRKMKRTAPIAAEEESTYSYYFNRLQHRYESMLPASLSSELIKEISQFNSSSQK